MVRLLYVVAASAIAWVPAPSFSQAPQFFYCYAIDADSGTIYLSDMHRVGPVAERRGYGQNFSDYLGSVGTVSSIAPAFCVMRATAGDIERGQQDLISQGCAECGGAKRFERVAWRRNGVNDTIVVERPFQSSDGTRSAPARLSPPTGTVTMPYPDAPTRQPVFQASQQRPAQAANDTRSAPARVRPPTGVVTMPYPDEPAHQPNVPSARQRLSSTPSRTQVNEGTGLVEWLEAVTFCVLRPNSRTEFRCVGPLQVTYGTPGRPSYNLAVRQACGSDTPRSLGVIQGYEAWGCGFGLRFNALNRFGAFTDAAARLGVSYVPGRITFRCSPNSTNTCRTQ